MNQVGPFRLVEILGKGGMGEVWRAEHVRLGVPLAVKLSRSHPQDLLTEAEQVAALDHPNVVRILDLGELPGPRVGFDAGSPYLAMELASEGSVAQRRPRSFAELRHLLVGALQGLAHAHANGIVHRDIKPGNLLLAGPRETLGARVERYLDTRVVVSDFGLALSEDPGAEGVAGTPKYMPPEQFGGLWREQGPWTDIYALCMMAWVLCTGSPPFRAEGVSQWAHAHVFRRPGAFKPRLHVPDRLEDWIRRGIAKRPADRFSSASEALEELLALSPGTGHRSAPEEGETEATRYVSEPVDAGSELVFVRDARHRKLRWKPRPWVVVPHDPARALDGAGLALFGLRDPPLLGREAEQKAAWQAVEICSRTRAPGGMLFVGAEGLGTSRLLGWLGGAVQEVGAGLAFVTGSTHDRPLQTLARAALGAGDLEDRDSLTLRVRRLVDERQVARTVHWLLGEPVREDEALALVLTVLLALARTQVVVIGLEGLDRSPVLQKLAHRVDEGQASILWVGTARDPVEGFDGRSTVLRPLDRYGVLELLDAQLGLTGNLASNLADRAGGNPGYVIKLTRDLIRQGVLIPGKDGFGLAPGAQISGTDPDRKHRIEAVLADRSADDRAALGVAAALGVDVHPGDWLEVVTRLGLSPRRSLIVYLRNAGVLRPERHLVFRHPAYREIATRWAPENTHRVAAEVLLEDQAPDWERVADHLLICEGPELLNALKRAAGSRLARGDLRDTSYIDALEARTDPGSHGAVEAMLLRAWRSRQLADLSRADAIVASALKTAHRPSQRVRAWQQRASIAFERGELEAAEAAAHEMVNLAESSADYTRLIRGLTTLGDCALHRGAAGEALQLYEGALEFAPTELPREKLAAPLMGVANAYAAQGEHGAARRFFEQAAAIDGVNLATQALIANALGDLCRKEDDLDAALEHYATAARQYRLIGSSAAAFPELNRGIVALQRGRLGEVHARMTQLLTTLDAAGTLSAFATAVRLPCLAGEASFASDVDKVVAFIERSGIAEGDLALCLELAGDRANELCDIGGAVTAWTQAEQQYRALGRERDARSVERRRQRATTT